jgi:hypothetical protein
MDILRSRKILVQATGWMTKECGFNSEQGQEIFFFSITSRPDLGPTQLLIQWVPGAVSLVVK